MMLYNQSFKHESDSDKTSAQKYLVRSMDREHETHNQDEHDQTYE